MSVSNLVTGVGYTANGVQTSFPITFDFKANSDVKVLLKDLTTGVETVQANPANFSVSGSNVVFVSAPTAALVVVIYRVSPRTQTTSYLTTGPFLPADHEEGLDKLLLQVQELARDVARSLKISFGNAVGGVISSTDLPSKLTANYALVVNSTGTGFDIVDLAAAVAGSAFITSLGNVGAAPNAAGMSVSSGALTLQPASSTQPGVMTAIAQTLAGAKTFLNDLTAGANLIVTAFLRKSAESGISAFSGGGQTNATQLTKDVNRVTVVLAANDSVKLPAAVAGMEVTVINDGSNSLYVFPSSGESIDALGVDAAYALPTATKNVTFVCANVGAWRSKAGGSGGSSVWGAITGTLSSQADLQTALNAKAPTASPTFSGTITTPLTASRALVTGAASELAVSATTSAQIGFLSTLASDVQVQITALVNTITSSLALAAAATLAISTTKRFQTFLVQGNTGAVTLSTTPFGATPPPDGAIIHLIGNSDTNTVEVPVNDAANGCLMDGNVVLARGQTARFMYSTTLARYVRL